MTEISQLLLSGGSTQGFFDAHTRQYQASQGLGKKPLEGARIKGIRLSHHPPRALLPGRFLAVETNKAALII